MTNWTNFPKFIKNPGIYFIALCIAVYVCLFLGQQYSILPTFYDHQVATHKKEAEIYQLLDSMNDVPFESDAHNKEIFRWCYDRNDNETTDGYLDCDELFKGENDTYLREAIDWKPPCAYTDHQILNFSRDCVEFKNRFNFLKSPVSSEEINFPLAFVLVVEKRAEQIARLLSAIYRSQNLYCLTYDEHSSPQFKKAMSSIIDCFPNIITPKQKRGIFWADYSLLEATMDCLEILSQNVDHYWKYVQILSWNDIPLKTNYEMVKIFKIFDGANDAELSEGQTFRFRQYHSRGADDKENKNIRKSVPPNGLVVYKGSYAATMSRDFIKFLFTDPTAKLFYEWSNSTWAPEEQFWSTLIHNIQLNQPGAYPGSCLNYYKFENNCKTWISRYQIWPGDDRDCNGAWRHGSCVFGVGDLSFLDKQPHLVAHKFYGDFQPAALYCMHRRLFEKNRTLRTNLSLEYYENLPAVRYQKLKDKNDFLC